MIKVKLNGHDYRYELFQIISLFYNKNEIEFTDELEYSFESKADLNELLVEFKIYEDNIMIISETAKITYENKSIKNAIKLTALRALKRYTGINIPWGILVGIRPTKIVHECFKENLKDDEILSYLTSVYDLSIEKACLALEVAKNESKFLTYNPKNISLYIDVPFCPTRCIYCSFTSTPVVGNELLIKGYMEAVQKEIKETLRFLTEKGFNIDTIYIGGGTPTALSPLNIEKILEELSKHIDLLRVREFTVEAGRPDSIDEEKLKVIKDYACSRISINPQTMNDDTLKRIGRNHTSKDVIEKYNLARNLGFDNINMDVIIGLLGETKEDVNYTMKKIKTLSPESITIHTMAVKRASVLNERGYKDKNSEIDDMYGIAADSCRSIGMYPYYMYRQKNMVSPLENVGYCKKDKECIYNIQMIAENISIAGIGPDAITKLLYLNENRIERVANVKDIREYINRIDEMIDKKIKGLDTLF
ncbi:oxygen-independent coproporphyrinogen-3 oxidase [Caloramator quimbayensis]|uniref:Oxygen-independent coproporphyrinogen-3 oxidase n=1 Tax=Caloramator quimbayensis TaxID=1147123 RepID=A0A1T4WVM0_9CLOT|nr:coproporphyrinogen dehydrogenase HemZ [Caloramator quimbayensis]SKA81354.1 oxygen-independent coproporphyrinogen-3 oxidase [Caloramator quimbayensis]